MSDDREFRVRPGRIRSKMAQRARPFLHQALAAAQKAGATVRNGRIARGESGMGRGRSASLVANRLLTSRSRLAIVKARVVRNHGRAGTLSSHLRYLRREGVTREGEETTLFGAEREGIDLENFADRCAQDRHHFRFIVSPEDAVEMDNLTHFTRDLMRQVQTDLGTALDWVGVSHWNTGDPHVHIVLRGVTDTGDDLVISRDYIKEGMRARAQNLITDELGARTDSEIRKALHRQIEAERFTQLDRQLIWDSRRSGFVDLAPPHAGSVDEVQILKAGRIRKLEALGLANQFAPGQWIISDSAEGVLRELGERGDIIKRIHRGLVASDLDRSTETFGLGGDSRIVGRLLARGHDDELKGTAYVVIDGTDGRVRHVAMRSLEATSDCAVGSIVSVRFNTVSEQQVATLRIESDLNLSAQVKAEGATWLDRQLVNTSRTEVAAVGFGAEVQDALAKRAEHLVNLGLAQQTNRGIRLNSSVLQTLRDREFESIASALLRGGVKPVTWPSEGEYVSGVYRQRLNLASGRFAVLDDGLAIQVVPWSARIEPHLGEPITGQMRSRDTVSWDVGRTKPLGIDI